MVGEDGHIKLTDYGVSDEGLNKGNLKSIAYNGSPVIYAPEILKSQSYDKSADWWSLVL